jgi:cold shock protein
MPDNGSGDLMATGTVKFFNTLKGYGFIAPDDGGADVFVHISALQQSGLLELRDGQAVEFQIEPGKNGKTAATNLKLR